MDNIVLEALIEKVKAKDEQAFQELYRRFYKKTYYAALKISGNQADAKDITQETFIQVYKSISSLQDNHLFVQWLNRIIGSKASDLFRKNKTTSLPEEHAVFQLKEEEHVPYIPEANLHFSSDRELLEYFINSLDERYRTVIVLHYFLELSIPEIAKTLNIPDGTVKTRLKRARAILKELIAHYQNEEETPLNFKSTDMAVLLPAFFLSELAEMDIDTPKWNTYKKRWKIKVNDKALSAISLCLIAVLAYCGVNVYDQLHRLDDHKTADNVYEETNGFGPIVYDGKSYENPEDAYYALTLFAHCEVEMKTKSKTELEAILPLYNELKRYQGVYWELLKFRDWNIKFEKVMNL